MVTNCHEIWLIIQNIFHYLEYYRHKKVRDTYVQYKHSTYYSSADFQRHVMFDPDDFCSKWARYCPCAGVLHPEAQKDKI